MEETESDVIGAGYGEIQISKTIGRLPRANGLNFGKKARVAKVTGSRYQIGRTDLH